ncbi:MAG TPA: hypothetical protein VN285_09340 [Candidatus Deferrimicrobium sp.]|nr:hypothetical protein [Candidatus Deferrimicrobium sp.]
MFKHKLTIAMILLLSAASALCLAQVAQEEQKGESACPAHRAAQLGHDPFGDFHKIMAPAWHIAWPQKEYESLLAAGPKFQEAFAAIAKMEPSFKSEKRQQTFTRARDSLGLIVKAYADASAKGNKETVYALMPHLHDAFEAAASSLLPISFPEIEGVVVTLDLILEKHLPANNREGIVGSTETLMSKFEFLTDTTVIPDELQDRKADIVVDVTAMKNLTAKMKECSDKNDMAQYQEYAVRLSAELKGFMEKYL